jgi:peroxiredoxin
MKNNILYILLVVILFFIIYILYKVTSNEKLIYKVPNIEKVTYSGKPFNLYKTNSQFILIVFLNDNCIPCLGEYKYSNKLAEEYSDNELKVIGILYTHNSGTKLKENIDNFTFPVIVDKNGKIFKQYGIVKGEEKKILINSNNKNIIFIDDIYKSPGIQHVLYKVIKKIVDLS